MPSPEGGSKWLLGVDGGGTKTHFLLQSADGTKRAACIDSGTYHIEVGLEGVAQVLRRGIPTVCNQAGIRPSDIAYAFFGLPAFGENPTNDASLTELPKEILGHDRFRCDNDVVCAWAGSLGGRDGINVVAGTGSIAYGEHDGRAARCGGWGELFGDEGSAYWTAVRGLNIFTQMSDGRLPRGPLHAVFREKLQLKADLEVLERFLEGSSSRSSIAALAPLVFQAAAAADPIAEALLIRSAEALARHAAALAEPLGYAPQDEVAVSYSGGMFSMGGNFAQLFFDALLNADIRLSPRRPLHSPEEGAVLAAARYARADLR